MPENKAPLKPTDTELEILQILWQNGPSTVRLVNEEQNKTKETGYTTTLKLLQIMFEKNLVTRDEESRSHLYQAAVTEEETQQSLLNRFLDTTFRGSAMKLVMQALGNRKTSPEELDQIRHLLKKLEDESSASDS
ncbi:MULTISPECIES: BlaI/MecI/CopY family transcriptional regulator [Rufibacter]|uniref:Putative transcriptional regulator n=1 Tax=Rufibacter quisquiliarum TaxID=1549639 RepID=A0A839GU56_9BACT|nr:MULTISPECIES: BlaI/MecI/CopY family transcriptional regulator [Rufibacter]MBA9078407.1 putative transcriptional regulator [Rufibacter quisquiliarum]